MLKKHWINHEGLIEYQTMWRVLTVTIRVTLRVSGKTGFQDNVKKYTMAVRNISNKYNGVLLKL